MSQLFTLQFPKYHFDKQSEFTINFPDAQKLPFSYDITNGMVCVDEILPPSKQQQQDAAYMKQHRLWKQQGLQEGVRIIGITNKDLTNEHDASKLDYLTRRVVDEIIREHTNRDNQIEITFREEILEFDDSVSLGLEYTPSNVKEDDENKSNALDPSRKSMQVLGISSPIKNAQIAASSCCPSYEPYQCRLNNPKSCWKPSERQKSLNNSWISVDLKQQRMITKLRLQGSPDGNKSHIKSIWVDFSDDGASWICHNSLDGDKFAEIECVYDKVQENVFGADDVENDKFAEVEIWPPINARFIRIRPYDYSDDVALRFNLYGPPTNRLEFARVVKYDDLSEENRAIVSAKVKNVNSNTKMIQVDCKSVIRKALDDANMKNVGFVETDKDNYVCIFSTADLAATERTIQELMDIGIGKAMGTAGICPMQFRRPAKPKKIMRDGDDKEKKKGAMTAGFYSSIKSRQIVDQLVDNTTQSAEFTYDYMSMLLVADVIAGMGLATNSAVVVVASMLVSPIMGPVLALTFGIHLRKFKFAKALAKLGLKNEFYSLIICVFVGFILGMILLAIGKNDPTRSGIPTWPTQEMFGRGQVSGLATGAIVAFASGIGVALSVVGDYMATVIGVAISASLLPPAVNCGMLWAQALYVYSWDGTGRNPGCDDLIDVCYDASDLAIMGSISIALTVENIILVFLASWMMFKIKDVTMSKDRGFDAQNRQLVYKSITSFKDRYDDIRTRSKFSMSLKKKPSLKRLTLSDADSGVLGKPLTTLTVDKKIKNTNLKKALLSYNTMRRFGGTWTSGGTARSAASDYDDEHINIIVESEEDTDEESVDGQKRTNAGYTAVGSTVEMTDKED